jgi:hypothetical protein
MKEEKKKKEEKKRNGYEWEERKGKEGKRIEKRIEGR